LTVAWGSHRWEGCFVTASWDVLWRGAIRHLCERAGTPLPWRERPDLSTVEGCLEALREAPEGVWIGGGRGEEWSVRVIGCVLGHGTGAPWTLADLQAAAREVHGLPPEGEEGDDHE
jgi:hypothetical protein